MGFRRWVFATVILASPAVWGQSIPSCPGAAEASTCLTAKYSPITASERFSWFVKSTIGPQSLTAGVFSAAIGTALDAPREYHPTWEGFGKRYGMRLTGISTGNAIESGLGALWREDPRYFRTEGESFRPRVLNVMSKTFVAARSDGTYSPAYARYAAIAGNNFLSNTWRADSEANVQHALLRCLYGILGRMGSNAFQEFWPDIQRYTFRRGRTGSRDGSKP